MRCLVLFKHKRYGGLSKKNFAPLLEELKRWRPLLDKEFIRYKLQIKSRMVTSQR
jgi:hypothetical protein